MEFLRPIVWDLPANFGWSLVPRGPVEGHVRGGSVGLTIRQIVAYLVHAMETWGS